MDPRLKKHWIFFLKLTKIGFPAYNLRIRLLQHLQICTVIGNDLIFHFKSLPGSLHHSWSPEPPRAKLGNFGHVWASMGMTSPKWHTQLLPFMDVGQHAKNQNETSSPSRDISNKIFLQFDWLIAFWAITRDPDFSQTCGFRRMIEKHNSFHFRPILAKNNDSILHKCPKTLILGTFGLIWAKREFNQKIGLCHFFAFMDP